MTDDKKTLKFQMMMSPNEAQALDDWMFRNRIRSRAEAIRRLWQMGMVIDSHLSDLIRHNAEAISTAGPAIDALRSQIPEDAPVETQAAANGMKLALLDYIKKQSFVILGLYAQIAPLTGLPDTDEAIDATEALKSMISSLNMEKREDYDRLLSIFDIIKENEQDGRLKPEIISLLPPTSPKLP
jgi:hypothetical protein